MGKVHGSLTRAGKVRKQTPKVEPKERMKKIVVGRAKKRKQYQKKYSVLIPEATAAAKKKYKSNKQELRK
jgi:small subunit ribosomal protein S30e